MTDATVNCPICKSEAKPLDRAGDWDGFDCLSRGNHIGNKKGLRLNRMGGGSKESEGAHRAWRMASYQGWGFLTLALADFLAFTAFFFGL
jgi:hypothetical protein